MKKISAIPLLTLILACPLLAESVLFEQNLGPPGVTVVEQSTTNLILNFSMPKVSFHTVMINGEPMTAIAMPGAKLGNNEDAPNLPGIGRFFALPQGAGISYEILESRVHRFEGLDIAPAMRIPADDDDSMPVFKKNPLIYGTNAYYPESPIMLSPPRQIRGVDAAPRRAFRWSARTAPAPHSPSAGKAIRPGRCRYKKRCCAPGSRCRPSGCRCCA